MLPKTAPRFWENDIDQDEFLKRVAWIRFCAVRFKSQQISHPIN